MGGGLCEARLHESFRTGLKNALFEINSLASSRLRKFADFMQTKRQMLEIPVYDVGEDFPMDLTHCVGDRGYELLARATRRIPKAVLRSLDYAARCWLVRNRSPFLKDIDALAARAGMPGLYYMNVQYEWGCTTSAKLASDGRSVVLIHTLDWDVVGIGDYVVAARVPNPLGNWVSLTWPAFTGVLQAVAPGRFAAAINQPTPKRRTGLFAIDWLLSKSAIWGSTHIQPIHLLRRVFETAPHYDAARKMLETTPITTPAIFTLAGVRDGETVVIERQENQARLTTDACVANEWCAPDWQALHHKAFENNRRLSAMRGTPTSWDPAFGWVTWPILNAQTRLAMMADAGRGRLLAQGYEAQLPATRVLDLAL